MNTLRKLLIGLAGFICILAISSFVSLLALRTTVMDREAAKEWLVTSNVYDGRLVSVLAEAVDAGDEQSSTQQLQTSISVSPAAVKDALNATFTPDFVQAQIEGVIDGAYDWTEGKSSEFSFSIPIDQKRDTLIQQLAKAIEPQVAALPICQSAQQSSCRPPNLTVEQLANQLTAQSVDNSGTFAMPITSESMTKNSQSDPSPLTQLPAIRKSVDVLLYILPVVAVASIVVIIFAAARERRLLVVSRLSRRIFVSMLLILIPAVVVVWVVGSNDFSLGSTLAAQLSDVMMPLIKIVIVAVSSKVALFSGIIAFVSMVVWIGFTIWRRKRRVAEAMQVSASIPPVADTKTDRVPSDLK